MLSLLLAIALGFYAGGATVTAITVKTIDGVPVTWLDTLWLTTVWWHVLFTAHRNPEEP